jgi:hypothetical protein
MLLIVLAGITSPHPNCVVSVEVLAVLYLQNSSHGKGQEQKQPPPSERPSLQTLREFLEQIENVPFLRKGECPLYSISSGILMP